MIVADTSALMAIVLDEPDADDVSDVAAREDNILISVATLTEVLIVAGRRQVGKDSARADIAGCLRPSGR